MTGRGLLRYLARLRGIRGLGRAEIAQHAAEPFVDGQEPFRQRQRVARFHRAAADIDQAVAVNIDHTPAGTAQARIDPQNTNRARSHAL